MVPATKSWTNADGHKIHCRIWETESAQKDIWIVHGMGDHGGRYEDLAREFVQSGYRVILADHRGNGLSEGKRGHVASFDKYLDDLSLTIEQTASDRKRYILGQSLGGLIVARYLATRSQEFEKAVLLSPMFRTAKAPPRLKLLLARLMRRIYPSLTLRAGFASNDLTSDENRKVEYRKDDLKHDLVSAELGLAMFEQGEKALAEVNKIQIPTLAMHGDIDKITCHQATTEFAGGNQNISLKLWPEMRHELHNELEYNKVLDYVINWLSGE